MERTHPDFKSIVDGVSSAVDICDLIGVSLDYQYMFEKRTSPWEMAEWKDGELENFNISAEAIDRLYHIHHYDDGVSGREYELLARMDYNGRSVYVKFNASCDFTGFDCEGGGEIYVSLDAQVFLKSMVSSDCNPHGIWMSMTDDDGLYVEEPNDFDFLKHWQWNKVPMLKFLCHLTVQNEQEKLQHYNKVLPDLLANSVTEFLKIRETKDHLES